MSLLAIVALAPLAFGSSIGASAGAAGQGALRLSLCGGGSITLPLGGEGEAPTGGDGPGCVKGCHAGCSRKRIDRAQ